MPTVFLSHSSKDKTIARQLASDLTEYGHRVFFDEWDIKVGDCIVTAIEQGIVHAEFVVILLSPNSVESQWVEREWKAKYWIEVEAKRLGVLPVLIADCDIPLLLKTRKYADFRSSYLQGLRELNEGLGGPLLSSPCSASESTSKAPAASQGSPVEDAYSLIASLNDRDIPLSKILPRLTRWAKEIGDRNLEEVSRRYMLGGRSDTLPEAFEDFSDADKARVVDMYLAVKGDLNLAYIGWGGSVDNAMNHVESSSDFRHRRWVVDWPVVEIEERSAAVKPNTLCIYKVGLKDLVANSRDSRAFVNAYFRTNSWSRMLMSMRRVLISLVGLHS